MSSTGEGRRHEFEIKRLAEATERLARALYALASIAAAVALATPVADLRLPGDDPDEPKTLLGMVGEFSDLRSAVGVQPIVVIAIVALLVVFVTGVVAAWGGDDRSRLAVDAERSAPRRTFRIRPAPILVTAGVVLILLALPLLMVLDAADHVGSGTSGSPPFLPRLGGAGMLVLTGIVAGIVARTDWRVRD